MIQETTAAESTAVASDTILEVRDVRKSFNGEQAVDGISFSVPRGTIYGLLGPNGAGKTTTIRMIMRILYPDSGDIHIFGKPLAAASKDRIGYLPEERGVYRKMKVMELVTFFGEIKGMSGERAGKAASDWLARIGLAEAAHKKVEELSKGMQQKVQFISTVMHDPEIMIFDEPFSGLDPVNATVLKDIILDYHRKGHTIIFSTHMMEQVEKLCREICLINKGRKLLEGPLTDIKRSYGHNTVTIRFSGDGSFLRDLPEVHSVHDHGQELFIRLNDGADAQAVLKAASTRLEVTKFEVSEPSIHDIFVEQVSS